MPFTESVPTQQAHPWRAVARTVLAVLVGLGLVVPLVVQALTDQLGLYIPDRAKAWLVAASAFTIALSGAVTRIIAIPAVDAWLRRLGLSSTPAPTRPATGLFVAGEIEHDTTPDDDGTTHAA